ncbi:MAG: RNA polymerase sigma factor [Acidobacteriota bacterium]|nr:MAG: RNA polymerase sigma factor [Acidobacteriota bacterium]
MAGDERSLIERARRRDRDAFSELVRGRCERWFWLCYRILGDAEEARDAVQEALLHMWDGLASYRPAHVDDAVRAFDAWCYRIAYHAAVDRVRERKRRAALSPGDVTWEKTEGITPEALVESKEEIEKMLSALAPREREAFVLCAMEGFSSEEAARIMDAAPSTVRNLVRQARGRLKKQ